MGKFETIIEARQKLCEFNEAPVAVATQPTQKNPVLDHITQDPSVRPAYEIFAQTGRIDNPAIQKNIQELRDQAKPTVDAALQTLQQQAQAAPTAAQPQQQTQPPAAPASTPAPQAQQGQQPPPPPQTPPAPQKRF